MANMKTRNDYFNEFIEYSVKARGDNAFYNRKGDKTKARNRSGLAYLRCMNPRIPA